MRKTLLTLSFLLCIHSLGARERPSHFISDPSNFFLRETKRSLESSLANQSDRLGINVFVLLEPQQDLPLEEREIHFKNLGNSWTDKNWTIISYDPDQIAPPLIVTGGPFRQEHDAEFWDAEIELLRELSLQSWSKKADIDFLARQISESLVFLSRAKDAHVTTLAKNYKQQQRDKTQALLSRHIFLATLAIASTLIVAFSAFLIRKMYLNQRKMRFPRTIRETRLGAPHSGGSSANLFFESHPK